MKNIALYENFQQELNEAKVAKGLMHKLLNVPAGEKISSKYKNGEELAKDLLNAVKNKKIVPLKDARRKATSVLAFAANWPSEGENTVIDKALRAIKKIEVPGIPIK
jgi:hypothetical protein